MDTTPKYVSCYHDNKDGEFAILTALAGIAADIKESEGDIKESIQIQTNFISNNQTAMLQKICDAEKAAIENRAIILAENKETKFALSAQLAECCCDMKTMNLELKQFITEKFCDLERRELNREIDELEQEKTDRTSDSIISLLNAILVKIK